MNEVRAGSSEVRVTATEELRRMLDERGVKHFDGIIMTYTDDADYMPSASNTFDVTLYNLTPAQAIDATLGQETCRFVWSLADNGWADHTCSACGYVENTDVHVRLGWHYCPNCGRKVVDA